MTEVKAKGAEATFATALSRRGAVAAPAPAAQNHILGRRKDSSAFMLDVARIRIDINQIRKSGKSAEDAETQELARSIKDLGVLNPITVRYLEAENIYEIVAGERRFVAMSQILHQAEVPVRVIDKNDEDTLWLQIHENVHRKELDALEMEAAIKRVLDSGLTMDQVAERLKKSVSYVQKFVSIGEKLSPDARQELDRYQDVNPGKRLGLDVVYEVATVPPEAQAELSKAVVDEDLPRAAIRSRAGGLKQAAAKGKPRKAGRPRAVKPFLKTFRASNGAAVTVEFKKGKPDEDTAALAAALREILAKLEAEN